MKASSMSSQWSVSQLVHLFITSDCMIVKTLYNRVQLISVLMCIVIGLNMCWLVIENVH